MPHQQHPKLENQPSQASEGLVAAARHIIAHPEEDHSLQSLARIANLSPSYFQRRFRAFFGLSPKTFHSAIRLRQFKSALSEGKTISEALYEAGYSSPSRIYETPALGMTPRNYRLGAAKEEIHYLISNTHFGLILIAATPTGVCLAELGDSKEELLQQLKTEFPNAKIKCSAAGHSEQLQLWLRALEEHILKGGEKPVIPLDLRGTAFQIKVWNFLKQLERGQTISYAELASRIGHPGASRAVGSACGTNKIALLVPCHRVLRGDGKLGGYRWGENTKQELLDIESKAK